MKLTPFQLVFWTFWVLFIFALTATLSDPSRQEKVVKVLSQIAQKPWFIPAFFTFLIVVMLCFWGPHWWRMQRQNRLQAKLRQSGASMLAEIIRVEDTGFTINRNPRVKLTVKLIDQEASFELTVFRVQIPRPGDFITVVYDPADPFVATPA